MYLLTRTGRLAPGAIREAMAFVTIITEKVQQGTGLDVPAWASSRRPR
jgi:hypothetical protein